jgi:hypothetical protein
VSQSSASARADRLAGRLLSYTSAKELDLAAPITAAHPHSGVVVRGDPALRELRQWKAAGYQQVLVVDPGAWADKEATSTEPLELPSGEGLFAAPTLDEWASSTLSAGADLVLTPSRFIRAGDWAALRAVLRAGQATPLPGVRTLVATDAVMLEPAHLTRFLTTLCDEADPDRLAFVFADRKEPLAHRERAAGLRAVVGRFPGCLVVGVDVLGGTDALGHGAAAAVGIRSGLRWPRRPGDKGGFPPAKGYAPGLFLRELWETRSPSVYSDWYRDSAGTPTCAECGGLAVGRFSNHPRDKEQILRHNVHAWLDVLTEITSRPGTSGREWLARERLRALAAHGELRPRAGMKVDKLLRYLCELDDPARRRTTSTGQWC